MVFRPPFLLVALVAAPFQVWAAIGPVANLNIVNAVISPDGFKRSAVLAKADGGVAGDPGPLITAKVGDTFQLNVVNQLNDQTMDVSTSIHWHGILQQGSNWADGAAFVNQCPIAPGHNFLYEFKASSPGTYWYHSHLRLQYCEGLRGALVVYDPQDPYIKDYDVDDDNTVITLADWYHSVGAGGPPLSTLINGKGRYVGGTNEPLTIVNVDQGKRYRLRIVSISCAPSFTFSIDAHNLTVIEADSILHQKLVVDQIEIFAGQRYSVILNASQPVDNYWIRAKPKPGVDNFDGGMNSAILRYNGAADTEPAIIATPNPSAILKESALTPLVNPGAPGVHKPGAADRNINLALNLTGGRFTVNGASYTPPTVPVLLQLLSGVYSAEDLLPKGSVYTLPRNAVIELSIPAAHAGGGPHPIHLHGHAFDVIKSAGAGKDEYDWTTPARRDVVSIGDINNVNENVTIRFTTDNPGPWILHCHIDRHLELGLAVVFAEAPEDTQVTNPVPPAWSELCPIYDSLDPNDQ